MSALLLVVIVGAAWGLVDGLSNAGTDTATALDTVTTVPTTTTTAPPVAYITPTTIEYKPTLKLDVYRPSGTGPFPAVLLIHGGAFTVGGRVDLNYAGVRLAHEGVLAASVDYTLNGLIEPAAVDIADAYHWLAQQPDVDPTRMAVMGTSAGCALSAWFALSTHEPRAAVLVACPRFFPDLVTADAPEILLVNNTGDGGTFPFSKTIREILTAHGAAHDFVVHEGGDHFSTLGDNWTPVKAWLLVRLRSGS
jgi:acetyl esterase/lipase